MTDDITLLFARIRAERPVRKRRVYAPPDCRYTSMCRALALQESKALRGYCKAGVLRPYVPIDYWAEWQRISRSNAATFGAAA